MPTSLPDHITQPDFAVAVRGYDRAQVDDYLGRVLEWLADAEERTAAAEEARLALTQEVTELRRNVAEAEERAGMPPSESMSVFGERIGEVMQSAMVAAEALRADAEHEARGRRAASAAECERMIGEASDEAERILERARDREQAISDRIADLAAHRAAAVDDLRRVHDQLVELLAASGADLPEPGAVARVAPGTEDTVVVGALAGAAASQLPSSEADVADAAAPGPATPTLVQPAVPPGGRLQSEPTQPSARTA